MVAENEKVYTVLKEIKHPLYTLILRSDGIVQQNTTDNAFFNISATQDFVSDLEKITEGVPHLILKIPGSHASLDNESLSYMATHEALRFSIAEAVIVRNLAQRIIGNFYLKFEKPVVRVKLFTKIEDAENWLDMIRKKE